MKKQSHIPGLDGLRGLAVLLVFSYHYAGGTHSSVRAMQWFGFLNKGGWVGVTLFFVLSGFLITGILWDSFNDPRWWRNFVIRRTLRIFPLYFATLLLVLLAAFAAGTFLPALRMIWVPVLFLQNIPQFVGYIDHLPSPLPLFHFWSLAVEEQFYLLWPFLLVLQKTRTRAKMLCIITFALACGFRVALWRYAAHPESYWGFLLSRAGELASGGWLAIVYRSGRQEWARAVRYAPACAILSAAGFVLTGLYAHGFELQTRPLMQWGLPLVTLFFAAILVLAIEPGPVERFARAAWLSWLGGISFGLYVFHILLGPVFHALTMVLAGQRSLMVQNAVNLIVAALGTIAAAMLSSRYLERPFLNLKGRYAPSRRQIDGSTELASNQR